MATKLVIEPLFEAGFHECSYGFRPERNATQAMEAIREYGNDGFHWVYDADIAKFFDSVDHRKLMLLVEERISDRRVLKLLRQWLRCGVMEDAGLKPTRVGTPQGGVISPLLANIFLNAFDRLWCHYGKELGVLVRYADDFVILCRSRRSVLTASVLVRRIMARLGLKLHPKKTKVVNLSRGREGFDFLGWHVRKCRGIQRNPRRRFVQRWPSQKAMCRIKRRIWQLTSSAHSGQKLRDIIEWLNPLLRGWRGYFRTGNSDRKFNQIDDYVHDRLTHWLRRRGGQRTSFDPHRWPHARFRELGLYQLRTTVRYPAQATRRRPLVSRVRENRTHGLKGGPTFRSTIRSGER